MVESNADLSTLPTRTEQPIILIRGFGGLGVEDEKRIAYQGFNDGTVYPQKRGENYIYEGLILRFMKSNWQYQDATNVVGYYGNPVTVEPRNIPDRFKKFDHKQYFSNDKVIIDPTMALSLVKSGSDPRKTLWVFRYYDLNDRRLPAYGKALARLIEFVQDLTSLERKDADPEPKVNIIAHSMGGLIVREAIQSTFPRMNKDSKKYINKLVTLGTPHQGISFQILKNWIAIDAEKELENFNPEIQQASAVDFAKDFPPERVLTVVGTNYRTYSQVPSMLNRLFSVEGEFGLNYNRSDGLVKQALAQLPGAPRTFVHKCHGGPDSLVTSREAFEVATRFLFGNIKVRLKLLKAEVTRKGFDFIGKNEFFFGVSIKPRGVDFDLFHQSAEAENCFGPFRTNDFTDEKKDVAFDWTGKDRTERLIWEGWLDTKAITLGTDKPANKMSPDIVMRLDVYVGERDLFGLGFSDNIVFRQQYYIRAIFDDLANLELRGIELHESEDLKSESRTELNFIHGGWPFKVGGTGFEATMQMSFSIVPRVGNVK